MLNYELTKYSNIFFSSGGVTACLQIVEQYLSQSEEGNEELEEELESVTTYALTSSCYEGDYYDYEVIRPIVPYLQNQLLR